MVMILMKIFLLIGFINCKSWTILKQNFTEKVLPKVLECGLCKKYSWKWHKQLLLTCNQCREARCLSCVTFKSAVETLIKTLDSDGRMYVQNFVVDFLQIRDATLSSLFKIETKLSKSRTKPNTFDVKVDHKSKKNRSQVVMKTLDDSNDIQYISKRGKRIFCKKL